MAGLWRWRVLDRPAAWWYRLVYCRRHGHHSGGGTYCLNCGQDMTPVVVYFGEPWNAHPFTSEGVDTRQVATPVGQECMDCGEPVADGDRGLMQWLMRGPWDGTGEPGAELLPLHVECQARGMLSHDLGQCHHFFPGRSTREEAVATMAVMNAERAEAGLGPWWVEGGRGGAG